MSNSVKIPTVHVISDSVGETARAVASAACAQFGVLHPKIEVLNKVTNSASVYDYLDTHSRIHAENLDDNRLLVFYTLVDPKLRRDVQAYISQHDNIFGVDLLTDAIEKISAMTGLTPEEKPGTLREVTTDYYKKIAAMEFTIDHDDGRNPQDLTRADIVIIGVSRTSKTPTSIYLAQQGFSVANVPLDTKTEPPYELFAVEKTRLFGLLSTPSVLSEIRKKRLGEMNSIVGEYADIEHIYQDLESSRKFMRQLGCIVLHTDGCAIEETAQRILNYYTKFHGL